MHVHERADHAATEMYLTQRLPQMVTAPADRAVEAYVEHRAAVGEVVGAADDPAGSNFSWPVLEEMIDAQSGGPSQRVRIAQTARRTSAPIVAYPIRAVLGATLRLHTDGGSFLVVAANDGRPLAADNVPNPEVPAHYGAMDPYVLHSIADAVLIEKLRRQGADSGEGYEVLTATKRTFGIIGPDALPHIGMSTLHKIPAHKRRPGVDRHALAYAGTSGRTMSAGFRDYITRHRPDYLARTVTKGERPDPDDLAGFIDTVSGMVACRAAVYPSRHLDDSLAVGWDTDWRGYMPSGWPDPNAPENVDVDWN